MENLIEIKLNEETKILIETSEIGVSDDLLEHVSGNNIIKKTQNFLSDALEQIKAFSDKLSETINKIEFKPDELEIEFAVKFSADSGIIISTIGTEANITVKMKWNKTKEE